MTIFANLTNLAARAINRGKFPKQPAAMQVVLRFDLDTEIKAEFQFSRTIRNVLGIADVQTLKIDNTNNAQTLSLTFDSGDNLTIPPYTQGLWPILFGGDVLKLDAISTGGVPVTITFMNTRENAQSWSTKVPIAGIINVSNSTVFIQPAPSGFTNNSTAIVAGGTSQTLLAANGNRKLLQIRNPATNPSQGGLGPEPIYLNFGPAAAVINGQCWELLPGESLPQFLMTSTDAVQVNAATTGHIIACYTM